MFPCNKRLYICSNFSLSHLYRVPSFIIEHLISLLAEGFFFHRQQYGCYVSSTDRTNKEKVNVWNDLILLYQGSTVYPQIESKNGYLDGRTIKNKLKSDMSNVPLFFSPSPQSEFPLNPI